MKTNIYLLLQPIFILIFDTFLLEKSNKNLKNFYEKVIIYPFSSKIDKRGFFMSVSSLDLLKCHYKTK